MVADRDDADAHSACLQHGGSAGCGFVWSCSDRGDAGRSQVGEGVVQCCGAEVHGVVVGQRHARDAHLSEPLGRDGRCAEGEALTRSPDALATIRDAALEVDQELVGLARQRLQVSRQQRVPWVGSEPLGHAATEHRVAREREPNRHGREGNAGVLGGDSPRCTP